MEADLNFLKNYLTFFHLKSRQAVAGLAGQIAMFLLALLFLKLIIPFKSIV